MSKILVLYKIGSLLLFFTDLPRLTFLNYLLEAPYEITEHLQKEIWTWLTHLVIKSGKNQFSDNHM